MIAQAMQFMNSSLDQFLRNRFGLDESKVVLNNLIESNGSIPTINQNKLVISLINVEKETNKAFYNHNRKLTNGNFSDVSPSERYNLIVLVSSNFDDYSETLKFLNAAILYFQANTVLDAQTSSNIPAGLHKLEFEVEKISYHQMQGLWTAMGAKYQPSIIYKMRLITIQANETEGFIPAVLQYSTTINPL
ncbi:DUF4255 domain-containing protein [Mucilaginibacter sp. L196]|uniref:DUF4255 domain-containing protein n=1 Tax=Mucilaginibacter sp. L196 TaxID=1641870 RepID=UPI00131D1352|nr:DUF4255 domain-containing protein [Mucilaginibacter sp. L196]